MHPEFFLMSDVFGCTGCAILHAVLSRLCDRAADILWLFFICCFPTCMAYLSIRLCDTTCMSCT